MGLAQARPNNMYDADILWESTRPGNEAILIIVSIIIVYDFNLLGVFQFS